MRTLVLGASTNPQRYSYIAARRLLAAGHEVCLVGRRAGELDGEPIHTSVDDCAGDIDTVTLYIGPKHQPEYYDQLIDKLTPRRIIFNPGTENPELVRRARAAGIACEQACTLVMLASSTY